MKNRFILAIAFSIAAVVAAACSKEPSIKTGLPVNTVQIGEMKFQDVVVTKNVWEFDREIIIRLAPGRWLRIMYAPYGKKTLDLTKTVKDEDCYDFLIDYHHVTDFDYFYSRVSLAKSGKITICDDKEAKHFTAVCEMVTGEGTKVAFNIDSDYQEGAYPEYGEDEVTYRASDNEVPALGVHLKKGVAYKPEFTLFSGDPSIDPLYFESDIQSVVEVDQDGTVTAIDEGCNGTVRAYNYLKSFAFNVYSDKDNVMVTQSVINGVKSAGFFYDAMYRSYDIYMANWECDFTGPVTSVPDNKMLLALSIPESFMEKTCYPGKEKMVFNAGDETICTTVSRCEGAKEWKYVNMKASTAFNCGFIFVSDPGKDGKDATVVMNVAGDDGIHMKLSFRGDLVKCTSSPLSFSSTEDAAKHDWTVK